MVISLRLRMKWWMIQYRVKWFFRYPLSRTWIWRKIRESKRPSYKELEAMPMEDYMKWAGIRYQ